MEELALNCTEVETDRLRLAGYRDFVNVAFVSTGLWRSVNLNAAGVAEAAGWLLGWLAEHAPEERAKLLARLFQASGKIEVLEAPREWPGCLTDYYAKAVREVYPGLPEKYTPGDVYVVIRKLAEEHDRLRADRDSLAEDLRASREAHANDQCVAALEAERRKVDAFDSDLRAARVEGAAARRLLGDLLASALLSGATVKWPSGPETWPEVTRG